jgi:hypothetical protein
MNELDIEVSEIIIKYNLYMSSIVNGDAQEDVNVLLLDIPT